MSSPAEVINRIFTAMDKDGNGSISCGEMDACFKHFDKDGSGGVSKEEWSKGFMGDYQGTAEQAEKVFKHLDKGGRGEISIDNIHEHFKSIDADGNGEVSKDEFQAFWLKILS